MRKSIFSVAKLLPVTLGLSLLSLVSCVPQQAGEDVEEEVISLSEAELLFANNGGSKEVSVGGAENWDFLSSEGETGWLKLEKQGNTLVVTAEPNPDGTERSGSVMVMGRTSQAKFNVKQSPADFILDFSESEITFPAAGGDKLIIVSANSQDWTFDPIPEEVTWLSVKSGKEVVTLTAAPLLTHDPRETSLSVTSAGGEKKDLLVKQLGVAKYYEPYISPEGIPYRPSNLIKFEEERGNILSYYSAPYEFYGAMIPGTINVLTSSDITPMISYNTELPGQPLYSDAEIAVFYTDPEEKVELKEYKEFIKGKGYAVENEEETQFRNPAGPLKLAIEETSTTDGFVATFSLYYPQTGSFPTFDAVPMGPEGVFEKLNDPNVESEDIEEIEFGLGSTLIADNRDPADPDNTAAQQIFDTGKRGKFDEALRLYWYVTTEDGVPEFLDTPTQIDLIFDDYTAAFWEVAGGKLIMTEEFTDLVKSEGYKLYATDTEGNYFYTKPYNQAIDQAMVVAAARYQGILDGEIVLHIAHFYAPKQASSTGSTLRSRLDELKEAGYKNPKYYLADPAARALMDSWHRHQEEMRKL